MMTGWSPLTRRALSLTILVFMILGLTNLVILPVIGSVSEAVAALQDSRFRLARLEAIEARPTIVPGQPVPIGTVIEAPDRAAASGLLIGAIGAAAAAAKIALDPPTLSPPDGSDPKKLGVGIGVTGSGVAVLSFVNALEKGQPLVRFRTWRFVAADGPPRSVRFEGNAVAVWSGSR
jgi:hypothetical protein